MSDLETSIKFAVFKHLGGDCVNDMCTFSTDCACHEESKSLGSQIYDEVAPPLSVTQKIVNWILMLNAIACAWIVYSEPGSVHLKILATLGVLAPFCQIVYELLTGRKTP